MCTASHPFYFHLLTMSCYLNWFFLKNQHMEHFFGWLGKFQALLVANGKGKIQHIYIWIIHCSLSVLVTLILIFMSHPQSPDYQKWPVLIWATTQWLISGRKLCPCASWPICSWTTCPCKICPTQLCPTVQASSTWTLVITSSVSSSLFLRAHLLWHGSTWLGTQSTATATFGHWGKADQLESWTHWCQSL